MGLDMYLNRMPRHGNATANDVSRVESFLGWLQAKFNGSEHAKCSFKEWCWAEEMPSLDDNVIDMQYGIRVKSMSELETVDLINELLNRGYKVSK